jgi:hypothetical protein
LLIRVGAAVDNSVSAAFKTTIAAAKAAQKTTAGVAAQGTQATKRELTVQADAHVKVFQAIQKQRQKIIDNTSKMAGKAAVKEAADEKKAAEDAAKAKVAAMERADKLITRIRDQEAKKRANLDAKYLREAEKDLDRRQKVQERTLARYRGSASRIGSAVGSAAYSGGRRALGFTKDVAMDIIGGTGVNLDIGSAVAANTSLESRAIALSNSGFMAGAQGPNGARQSSAGLVAEARSIGESTAFDPGKIMEGLQAFTGKTGDLQAGRDALADLAVLSKATGTNLEDMVDAAGDVYSALGDIPNKGLAIVNVMKSIAGQGKLGAVEVKDLATQMAKIGAATGKFEGGGAKNLAIFGAFAQEARQRGGASSATQAATSVQSFANTFSKTARFDAFKALGIDVMSKTETGKFRDPRDLIVDALVKTKGDPNKMNKLVADAGAKKVVGGFQTVFQDAYNTTKGTDDEKVAAAAKAVREEMDRLTQAAMGEGEVMESFKNAMGSTESKATLFNNKLEALTAELESQALPALEQLAPQILALVPAVTALVPPMVQFGTMLATWVGDKSGANQNAEEKGAVVADVAAFNSVTTLRHGLKTGNVSTADKVVAEQNAAAEDIAIAAKKKAIAEERSNLTPTDPNASYNLEGLGGAADVDAANKVETEKAEQLRANEKQLAEMVRTRETLGALLKQIAEKKAVTPPQAPPGKPHEARPGSR